MTRILFICLGNICRSPMAEFVMKDLVEKAGIAEKFEISTIPRGTFFYTDASQIIPQLSIPFVIAGPGDDSLAHCTNEYIELDSVARFAGLYYRYILGEIC